MLPRACPSPTDNGTSRAGIGTIVTFLAKSALSGRWLRRQGLACASLVFLGVAATVTGLDNRFVQDDLPLIVGNDVVHTLTAPARFFTTPYWHEPFPAALYRPLATATHAIQWAIGGGSAVPYRVTSVLMLVGAGLALFGLAARLLPRAGAWAAAAVFMVHPVHVEATAPGVNQGELMVGLLLSLAVTFYMRRRSRGALDGVGIAVISALYLTAVLFKEHALILPALLLAAEVTVIRDRLLFRARIAAIRPLFLTLGLVASAVLALRSAVIGEAVGTPIAEALRQSGVVGRTLTMLGVVPQWTRLLLWPQELQADYGPNEIVAARAWGMSQSLGAAILCGVAWLLLWGRKRWPSFAFGLVWTAVAVLPVSNVLVPSGIVLAERTLFLPSMGVALAGGALFGLLWTRVMARRPLAWATAATFGLTLTLGLARSVCRTEVWRTQETLLRQTVVDAPRSYTAHLAMARFLEDSFDAAGAARHYRAAVALVPAVQHRERIRAETFRHAGYCRSAVRHYRRALLITPTDTSLRHGLALCLAQEGRDRRAVDVQGPASSHPTGASTTP